MVTGLFYASERGNTIGVKAFLIGDDRASRHQGTASRVRSYEHGKAGSAVWYRASGEGNGSLSNDAGASEQGRDWGSTALGLSECEMLGYEPKALEQCSYSLYVCAGFSTRLTRIREHKTK